MGELNRFGFGLFTVCVGGSSYPLLDFKYENSEVCKIRAVYLHFLFVFTVYFTLYRKKNNRLALSCSFGVYGF